ncbi:MAG: hypothetical protein M0Z35_00015 [Desulfitobacterium hafniense]|nr:hypothetical protein [Desulfitobacterium hafniense]
MSDLILFLGLALLALGVFVFIAHVDTYFGLRKRIKQEHLEGFNFATYTASEVKRYFTGKGIF